MKHAVLLGDPGGGAVGIAGEWLKTLGEYVAEGDALITVRFGERVETIRSDRHGVLSKLGVLPGETVEAGEPLAVLSGVAARPLFMPPAAAPLPPGTSLALTPLEIALARHDAASVRSAPHIVTVIGVDLSETLRLAERASCAPLAFLVAAVASALREHPRFNAVRMGDDALHLLSGIHLAVGENLIRDADKRSVLQLARELTAGERGEGATFTVTDLSDSGVLWQAPILRQPQTGHLSVGAVDSKSGRVHLCLAHDVRVASGRAAAEFLGSVRARLENADFLFV